MGVKQPGCLVYALNRSSIFGSVGGNGEAIVQMSATSQQLMRHYPNNLSHPCFLYVVHAILQVIYGCECHYRCGSDGNKKPSGL